MPPEIQEKAAATDRLVLFVKDIILVMVMIWLMYGSSISAYAVGLTTSNWKSALGLGVLFSLFPLGLSELALQNIPIENLREQPESHGPITVWYGLITLGSFAPEFWRALCIVSLMRLGLSAWLALLIVAVVYGVLHTQISIARALGSVVFGGAAGFLFVDTGSLLAPLTMGLIVAGANIFQIRQASSSVERLGANRPNHDPESRSSQPCPLCGAVIRLAEVHKASDILACPNCGESLTTTKKNLWVVATLSIVASVYITRHLVYREPVYVAITEGLAFAFFLLGAFLVGLFIPPRYKLVGGKTFDKTPSLFAPDKPDPHKKSVQK